VLARKLGIRRDASAETIVRLCRERLKFTDDQFLETVQQCEHADYDPEMKDSKALQLVQKLTDYQNKLLSIAGSKTEKH
jgi:hypothetical protein